MMVDCCGLEWSKVISRRNVVDMEEVIEMSDEKMIDTFSSINNICEGTIKNTKTAVNKHC